MNPQQPPLEFNLVAACCRWPRTAGSIDAIRRLATAGIDWAYFRQLIGYHRVGGLVRDGFAAAGVTPPAQFLKQLDSAASSIARNSLQLSAESVRLQHLFDREGISCFFLKGAALGQRAYGSIGLKHSWDIDLFVAQADAEATVDLLERAGYAPTSVYRTIDKPRLRYLLSYIKELPLMHSESRLVVEVTWRQANNYRLFNCLAGSLPTKEIALSNHDTLRTLTDENLLVYLCVHGACHTWNRLKWLADMHALLVQFTPSELARLLQLARQRGSDFCVGQALLLCERIFDYRLPGELAVELHRSGRLNYLVNVALKRLTATPAADLAANRIASGAPTRLYSFLLGHGFVFLREQIRITLVQSVDVMMFPLPRRLFFLYPVLRIPFFLWRHVISNRKR